MLGLPSNCLGSECRQDTVPTLTRLVPGPRQSHRTGWLFICFYDVE